MGTLDLYLEQMPSSGLQSTRVYWHDMLHMAQLPTDVGWYETKKKTDITWLNQNGLARKS